MKQIYQSDLLKKLLTSQVITARLKLAQKYVNYSSTFWCMEFKFNNMLSDNNTLKILKGFRDPFLDMAKKQ